jgi:hypothetical protein
MPLVRLSRDRKWAVCARAECGERFAERTTRPLSQDEMNVKLLNAKLLNGFHEIPQVRLTFVPGWVNDEKRRDPNPEWWRLPGGVWTMSRRFRERQAFRRPNRSPYRHRTYRKEAVVFPAVIVCPACNLAQIADEERLGLDWARTHRGA